MDSERAAEMQEKDCKVMGAMGRWEHKGMAIRIHEREPSRKMDG